ncbi:MAG: class I poly(R)-hydroxyalkanoic acid synthase [Betaproteobacteria bacterium]|nr:class I poly(R)-hydroxyalkanoic acid synthase [Betaproteobacteria bacterium]
MPEKKRKPSANADSTQGNSMASSAQPTRRRASPRFAGGKAARGRGAAASAASGASAKADPAAQRTSQDTGSPGFPGLPPLSLPPGAAIAPARLAELQAEYLERWQALVGSGVRHAGVTLSDRRFANEAWHDSGPHAWTAALYLLNAEFLQKMAASVESDARTQERIRFATQQWVDMMSPANFLATNPEAQRRIIDTRGESLRVGLENLFSDLEKGRISQTDEEAFEVGRNVATSPGGVVFQNDLIQIVQYTPSTPKVGSRPLLMVPPSINKFYIMDLQPDNSLVAYAVSRGHTVFMLSWRNVGPELGHLTWDDYLEQGIFEAIRAVREISGAQTINALGFCVGGTILATALAALAARGERPVASLTLMTTLLDFAEPGSLGVFVDEAFVRYREQTLGGGGILKGQELATTFSFLRPNDLVWNYVVSNYLKGDRPPAFDLLYWNSDSTNLPGPMYAWYLRHMYLQNELRIPDRLVCAGQPIDLRRINVPTFVFGAREDHIVLWRAAYGSTQLLDGPVRFVLGASGHIAGAINPVSRNKRSYWVGPDRYPADPEAWLAQATERPGSWWQEWADWLDGHRGPLRAAPAALGARGFRVLEPAPGTYVKTRAPQ